MRKIIRTICLLTIIFLSGSINIAAKNIHITTPNISIVLSSPINGDLKYLYFGNKLSDNDLLNIESSSTLDHYAYPVYGLNCPSESALAVTHSDGNMTLDMQIENTDVNVSDDFIITKIELKDKVYPFYVNLFYKAYKDVDIIETWSEIQHKEKKSVNLRKFASAYMPIRRGNVWLSSLYGSWANESQLSQEPLMPGMKIIKNKDGTRNSHTAHSEVMFSLDGKPQENNGRVIGAALCYGGNYKLKIDTDDSEFHQFYAGINEDHSEYILSKGELFVTPPLAITYSEEGLSGCSRNFHKWGRNYKLANGDKVRKILLNSWEGVYFDITEQGMDQMMADFASIGGELFVMDDGWFGDKFKRNTDNSSLGDWIVDESKLPNGISNLINDANKHGVKFGIWIEPEMTNTSSQLYEKHPDWILKAPMREPVLGRGGTQLVLDLSNPKVQDFIFNLVDTLMIKHPELDYIKWDANMGIMNHGSNSISKDKQCHMYIEYHRGFENICKRIRSKYPDLTIQACASGGGRANYGILPYFDEFWVSDNTDALQRIYMQWGTSYFFPAIAMGSHISAAPNHQTFRSIPMKYRVDVAMSGRLGMEIQLKNMTDDEIKLCKNAIKEYKDIRPIVQMGEIYRLISPYDGQSVASMMYVTENKEKSVFYWWKTEQFHNQHLPRVKMAGLDIDKNYKITELNRIDNEPLKFEGKVYSGNYLMSNGLEIPYIHNVDYHKKNDYSSRILLLEEIK